MKRFLESLRIQRWDDHRYYHQSRINQTLHLFSALSFLIAYVMLLTDPVVASLVGWLVAMTLRQAGHFFFEPKGYDHVNDATHDHKERIKVGYNLRRKVVLLSIWVAIPLVLLLDKDAYGMLDHYDGGYLRRVGLLWLGLGVAGLVLRTLYLCLARGAETGFVWMAKILTDPFHDVKLYYKAPFHLMRGELIDPMPHARQG
ncbi:MAG: hypothetical protein H6934_04820 [Burkholderiaceae bacterium]|nr:hypothetical protein [Burkholderiaceae bacterium]